jgi:hypothetical protein
MTLQFIFYDFISLCSNESLGGEEQEIVETDILQVFKAFKTIHTGN